MTPDTEAFIQQSLLSQPNTQPAAAASAALTAVVLRPPLSTATTATTSTAVNKTTVISLTHTPHSKPGVVILLLVNYYLCQWWAYSFKWKPYISASAILCLCYYLHIYVVLIGHCWMCAGRTTATGDDGEATGHPGSISRSNIQRTTS